jgi:hypothetical protein
MQIGRMDLKSGPENRRLRAEAVDSITAQRLP